MSKVAMRNGSKRAPARWLIALAACCVFAAAHAERADRDKPVNLEADQVTVDDNKQDRKSTRLNSSHT